MSDIDLLRKRRQAFETKSPQEMENLAVTKLLERIEEILEDDEDEIDYAKLNVWISAIMHLRTYNRQDPVQVKLAELLTTKFRFI